MHHSLNKYACEIYKEKTKYFVMKITLSVVESMQTKHDLEGESEAMDMERMH